MTEEQQQQEQQQEQPAGPVDLSTLTPAQLRERYIELWGANVLRAALPAPARSALAGLTPAQIREMWRRREITVGS